MRSPWAGAAALEDLSIMVSRWLRDHGTRDRGGHRGDSPPPFEEPLEPQEEEPKGERGLAERVSPPRWSEPRRDEVADGEALAERRARDAGRSAMLALRGSSPQLLPKPVRVDPGKEGPKEHFQRDPRKLAAPKAEASVKLIPAGGRGGEPWMDEVSVQGDVAGVPQPDDRDMDRPKKRRREASRDRHPVGTTRAESGGDLSRGGFFDGPKKKENRKKKHKEKDRKRRRRTSSASSTRSDGGDSSEGSLYGKDRHKHTPLAEKAKKKPGRLLKSGLEEMSKYLARRLGEGSSDVGTSWREQRVGAYVSQVLMVQHPAEKMGPRNAREIQTLSLALDALMDGQYALCGDYLMQRLKAVESSLTDGWKVAEQQEIVPPARASLTSDAERNFAARRAVAAQKLLSVVKQHPR